MPLSLPRGLGPVRLIIIFFILLSLILFRSYYIPTPDQPDFSLSSSNTWWKSGSSAGSDDTADVDLDHDYGLEDTGFVPALTEFVDSLESTSVSASSSAFASASGSAYTLASASVTASSILTPAVDYNVPACRQLPGADKVVVIVKTGATEVFARIPEQILTLAECAPNFMIFSDMEQELGDFHIHDALDEIGTEYKENHEDFQFYNSIHAAYAAHGDVSVLGSDKAWNLDKWKNIPMLHKAYTRYPDAEWYITIDADTYLGWTNLLLLLDHMDPDEPLYAGCIYWHGPTAFAQGGTGYLLSRGAVQKFEEIRSPEKIADWEKETSTICCGDVMLGVAMSQAGVGVSGAWPMFQVDPPSALGWSDRLWCTPAITWHHAKAYEVDALWQFEKEWINKTWDRRGPGSEPYLYRDAFEYFVQPHIDDTRSDWNNLSGDQTFTKPTEDHINEDNDWDWKSDEEKQDLWTSLTKIQKRATRSVEHCREACEDDHDCVQWTWHPGTCKLNYSIKLGHAVGGDLETTSGWMMERIEEFKKARGECDEPQWQVDR
ncbi:uncharacterized protein Z518_07727 [Rhinocladiella mackenziei CBS 650.93]|uniref:N-acetylgalactosaminide beta-1,3-galactosyltransferase n=1 Tax=Rhinocladiella mackenziei CBS 650.93 TaxID=1442369 RepID=A0A0D2H144_9EURO|nr:uncharacterized protein Z518_07727 [Rhinocladiella mackenziei CBS 650.93]KIX04173.1 hypothetical protein Z518_07727 [Rhinocladiella mackenziei CBS 650.93]